MTYKYPLVLLANVRQQEAQLIQFKEGTSSNVKALAILLHIPWLIVLKITALGAVIRSVSGNDTGRQTELDARGPGSLVDLWNKVNYYYFCFCISFRSNVMPSIRTSSIHEVWM